MFAGHELVARPHSARLEEPEHDYPPRVPQLGDILHATKPTQFPSLGSQCYPGM
jgi:hypothetical protein